MIERSFKRQIALRLDETAPLIQVVVGPRQVGKTTAIRQLLKNRGIYFTADSPVPLGTEEIEKVWRNNPLPCDADDLSIITMRAVSCG